MKPECTYCKYARQDYTGMWYCTLANCIVKGVGSTNDKTRTKVD
jgi:hypothetical protein